MPKLRRQRRRRRGGVRKTKRRQQGGIFPLMALALPAIVAASKAAAMGSVGAAAGFGIKKGLERIK